MNDALELRYSDGPTTQCEISIKASPLVVWALVSDIHLPARFSSEFTGAEFVDGATEPARGVRFVGRNQHGAIGKWDTTSTITEFEPGEVFGFVVGDPAQPSATWRFTLEPISGEGADSATRLTYWMRMGPARSGINIAIDAMPAKESKILHRRLAEHETNMRLTLDGIRTLAEAAASP
jgi:Polyketide cyclase / dehydrase and lipid transport